MTPLASIGAVMEHFQDLGAGHLADDGGIAKRQNGEHVAVGQKPRIMCDQRHSLC